MDTERFFASPATRRILGDMLLIEMNAPAQGHQLDRVGGQLVDALKRYSDESGLIENLPSFGHVVGWIHSNAFHDFLRDLAVWFPPAADELRRRGVPINAESATPGRAAPLNRVNS